MNQSVNETGGAGPSHRSMEIAVATFISLLALIGLYGSLQVGIGWGAEGPKAGFFPFYISLIILISCAVNITQVVMAQPDGKLFAEWSQIRQVMSVLVPTVIYVLAVPYTGMYVASAVLIGFFMRWFGHYRWSIASAVAIGVPVLTFFMFEVWFLVPLPKGPLEHLIGY